MMEDLKELYLRFNYSEEKGFIFNAPTLKKGEHISIGFDNKRKQFNVHFTDDNINQSGAKRRNFIFVISAFRFFLFLKRFEIFYNQRMANLVLTSKTNLGKLKKHNLIINALGNSIDLQEKMIFTKKKGKHWKIREDFDLDLITDNFKYIGDVELVNNSFYFAYKMKRSTLSLQDIIYKFENVSGIYFIPIKKYNRITKNMAIAMYNHFNKYPNKETLPFRKLLYERLRHPYHNLSKEE
jgi:hypothetical protein